MLCSSNLPDPEPEEKGPYTGSPHTSTFRWTSSKEMAVCHPRVCPE